MKGKKCNWCNEKITTNTDGICADCSKLKLKEMVNRHNRFISRELNKAENGEIINLTDLFMSKEKILEKD